MIGRLLRLFRQGAGERVETAVEAAIAAHTIHRLETDRRRKESIRAMLHKDLMRIDRSARNGRSSDA